MAIQTKDDAQSKADRRVDRALFKKSNQKQLPLIQRDFRDLMTLAEQFEWVRLKKIEKDKQFN
jgi:hypothetical protein